jgi:hypothetical protein
MADDNECSFSVNSSNIHTTNREYAAQWYLNRKVEGDLNHDAVHSVFKQSFGETYFLGALLAQSRRMSELKKVSASGKVPLTTQVSQSLSQGSSQSGVGLQQQADSLYFSPAESLFSPVHFPAQPIDSIAQKNMHTSINSTPQFDPSASPVDSLKFVTRLISHLNAHQIHHQASSFYLALTRAFANVDSWFQDRRSRIIDCHSLRLEFTAQFLNNADRHMILSWWKDSMPIQGQSIAVFAYDQKIQYEQMGLGFSDQSHVPTLIREITKKIPGVLGSICRTSDFSSWDDFIALIKRHDVPGRPTQGAAAPSSSRPSPAPRSFHCDKHGPNPSHNTSQCKMLMAEKGTADNPIQINAAEGVIVCSKCARQGHDLSTCYRANPCTICKGFHRPIDCYYFPAGPKYETEQAKAYRAKYPTIFDIPKND